MDSEDDFMILGMICSCARCGEDHSGLKFRKLVNFVFDNEGVIATHWASCPTNGDPILMVISGRAS